MSSSGASPTSRPEYVLFPSRQPGEQPESVRTSTGVIVIVGANGSGKSRLGAWIETEAQDQNPVHRISAQKVLELPITITSESISRARQNLLFGTNFDSSRHDTTAIKMSSRWQQSPTTLTLNDFAFLLRYLFADHFEVTSRYHEESQATEDKVPPPSTRLQRVQHIWESVILHRRLDIGGFEIHTKDRDGAIRYEAREMSDGERVVFYLAGECLAAETNSIIIVDEPEIHLHRSIQSRLWDAIEAERSDCLFVYLTHDLEFAATRKGATKIVVEAYDGNLWQWTEIPELEDLPEAILLEIVGSRKPVLFCEGEANSLDYLIYSHVYPDYTIIPVGSCEHVIHVTRSFALVKALHRYKMVGIVDRDQRTDEEIEQLAQKDVYVLPYSEIEHVFLAPEILSQVATEQCLEDVDEVLESIKQRVLKRITDQQEQVVCRIAAARLERYARTYAPDASGRGALHRSLEVLTSTLDVEAVMADAEEIVEQVVRDSDYVKALKVYEHKGLANQVSTDLGLASGSYSNYVVRKIKNDGVALIEVFQQLLPVLPDPKQAGENCIA